MHKDTKYFNYPIHLQHEILTAPYEVLNNIFDFAIVKFANELEGSKEQRIKYVKKHFALTIGNEQQTWSNGSRLQNHQHPMPYTGIGRELWFDFYKNIDNKTEFQLAQLAAFQGIKSILGKKTATKTNRSMIVARMFGYASSKQVENSPLIEKYSKRYHFDKLINQLEMDWNLKVFSNHIRGMYVSFDLDYKALAELNENGKRKNKLNELKTKKKQALRECYAKCYG